MAGSGSADIEPLARDESDTTPQPPKHTILPHTADAGIEASAADLASLFEEAARALIELTTRSADPAPPTHWEPVDLVASDVTSLAFGWLNELIGLGDIGRGAVLAADIDRLEGPGDGSDREWTLRARVGLRRHEAGIVEALRQAKSATYHGLAVEQQRGRWTLRAYLDM